MTRYALATISVDGGAKTAAMVLGDKVATLDNLVAAQGNTAIAPGATLMALLEDWAGLLPELDAIAAGAEAATGIDWHAADAVHYHPPVEPRQIFCTGANYRTHVVHLTIDTNSGPEGLEGDELREWAEKMMDDRLANGDPYVFTKPFSSIAGANDTLVLPKVTTKPDWELELAVVIGKEAYQVSVEDAMDCVAGYAMVNDVSARDLIPRTDYKLLGSDWLRGKGMIGFLPFGPYIVPAAFIRDPYDLGIRLSVEGQLMQNETTGDMMFDIARQIEYITRYAKLLPGDIICTGSPAGNGTHYNRFLRDGDLMVGEIDGLGAQRIRCVAEGA